MPNAEMFGPASLAISQSVNAFGQFLPKLSEVRKADPATDPEFAADVRLGEVASVTLAMGIGIIASSLTGSPVPAFTALFMSIVFVVLYESTLKSVRPFEHGKQTLRVVPNDA